MQRIWPRYILIAGVMIGFILPVSGCGGGADSSDPRDVVIAMFGAMEQNDKAALAHLLDLTELMKDKGEHYALSGGESKLFTNPQQILDDLTNDGKTKTRWFSLQRIVNKSQILGETATVEVSFVDKEASKGYLTKFGLKYMNGKWRIYSFQTEQQP